ncbi:MAG: cation:proton antiporter [Rhodospirillales bacterium]|nr:cation:proton antiporter [Rhodospirillales bacterium]
MSNHAAIPYLQEIVVFLVAAGIIVPVFHRLRVSPVLGYLAIGGIIGPFGLGLFVDKIGWLSYAVISDIEGVHALAELGVVFLLFMIGLELSLDRLWSMRRLVFGLGSAQVGLTAAALGAVAWVLDAGAQASILLGASLALSSTAIVMQILVERRALGTPLGQASFSILLLQDLAVVPILFTVGVFGAKTEQSIGLALVIAVGKALAIMIAIYIGGRVALRPLFNLVAHARSIEMFVAAALLVVIGTSALVGAAGLSMALGAFLAGLLLAETEYRHEINVDIEPFKGLFLGLFFMSVGMGIDYRAVGEQVVWIVAAVVGLFVVKSTIATGLCLAFGLPRYTSLEAGLLLGQGGEFAFVVVGLAATLGLLPPEIGQFVLIVVSLAMVATPLVAIAANRLAATLERRALAAGQEAGLSAPLDLEGHVVIAGFGRVGRTLGQLLDDEAIPYVAVDLDASAVAENRRERLPVYYGDASRLEILRRARVDTARALVVTMDNTVAGEHVVRVVHGEWPHLPIYARARDAVHAARLLELGATEAILETIEASLQLGGRVLEGTGMPMEAVQRRISAQREIELAAGRR